MCLGLFMHVFFCYVLNDCQVVGWEEPLSLSEVTYFCVRWDVKIKPECNPSV